MTMFAVRNKLRRLRRISISRALLFAVLTAVAVFMLLPIVFIINNAFKPFNELFLFPPTFLVKQPTWTNFSTLFLVSSGGTIPFTRYLFNSVLISSITLVCVILASSLAGYVLSKHRFPFKSLIFSLILVSLMFAPETVGIPRYLVISGLGLNNTYFGHVLPFLASTVGVFLMKQFIDQVPDALLEAGKLDGASEFGLFTRIVMPICFPAIATISILTFQAVWMDTEASTLYMQDETMKTLPYYVLTLTNGLQNSVAGQGMAAAAGLLIFLPNLIIFLLFQKKVMETMVHSGVK